MTHPFKFLNLQLQPTEDHNMSSSSLCYSSLSESSLSSDDEEEQRKQKVIDRKYSRLAYTVQRVGKDETEEANEIADQDDDSSTEEITSDLADGEEQKKKVAAGKYSKLAFTVQQFGKK
mmetsp:Transcript_16113/g.24179  ORF Transcript_16113/g.24179 Transcript_16113/m.24179 type:complete len:119 (+) Transcript_16113:195-551(+)|eukprot:CAMPEP_0203643608 /NCGR_PEP_ID=MMETSP0088-20131115/9044_1 /ASSEMBLY_ACC=CAM_ASM_001087 /TAXON_ID=426623 /ORGANISM="Chaetoceros affinis, Strain CCMP159" /LENGTH=118 /DNA_ID=CAMNT_0050499833 /DNA_START=22 /DNA_END=378 /DNA_ORIENTATION=+